MCSRVSFPFNDGRHFKSRRKKTRIFLGGVGIVKISRAFTRRRHRRTKPAFHFHSFLFSSIVFCETIMRTFFIAAGFLFLPIHKNVDFGIFTLITFPPSVARTQYHFCTNTYKRSRRVNGNNKNKNQQRKCAFRRRRIHIILKFCRMLLAENSLCAEKTTATNDDKNNLQNVTKRFARKNCRRYLLCLFRQQIELSLALGGVVCLLWRQVFAGKTFTSRRSVCWITFQSPNSVVKRY